MKTLRLGVLAALLAGSTAFTAPAFSATKPEDVATTYTSLALAGYEDSLTTARSLQAAVDALVASPSEATLAAARDAWRAARTPYQQTEAFRFGNPIVDDWEGRVNAWPLDEGLIDYVDPRYGSESDTNPLYTANVIANPQITINGKAVDGSVIDAAFLRSLQEADGIEANVATGYHAIEFLLWGQDLNGTGPGAGNRPYTDYDTANCTNGHCDRRGAYLKAAAALLVSDLEEMVGNWKDGGPARARIEADPRAAISAILTGMGSLSYGELAGERMKLGLLLHDPEEEHDCFSDNTAYSHRDDALGIENVYRGRYQRVDGSVVEGPSIADYVAERDAGLDAELKGKLRTTVERMQVLVDRTKGGEAYDQMIGEGNAAGNAAVQAGIDGLIDQTRSIERVIAALGLDGIALEGSDSLDNPGAVFQ